MICSIHQPNFIPYLGFFDKVKKSNIFVLYDTAQYSKNEFHNRNKIKTAIGGIWLTVPVSLQFGQNISEVQISNTTFIKKHLKSIKHNYSRSPYFGLYFPKIEQIYLTAIEEKNLANFNIRFLTFFFDLLSIKSKIVKSSELKLGDSLKSTQAIIEICKRVGANEYLSGPGAKDYLDVKLFEEAGIKIIWQSFVHPVYPQDFGAFLPNMSVLDAVFNVGPELKKVLSWLE